MKRSPWLYLALLAAATPAFAAPGSCEQIKSDIGQRIINNGVPESSFSLAIMPGDQANQSAGQVVGHCANDGYKIFYIRNSDTPEQTGSARSKPADNNFFLCISEYGYF